MERLPIDRAVGRVGIRAHRLQSHLLDLEILVVPTNCSLTLPNLPFTYVYATLVLPDTSCFNLLRIFREEYRLPLPNYTLIQLRRRHGVALVYIHLYP